MIVTTEIANTFVDKYVWSGVIVMHVYRTDDDEQQATNFYFCKNQSAADALVTALKNPDSSN